MDQTQDISTRIDRNLVFTRELLAEADDVELQSIVEGAARDLQSPIALVTMVMEHVQFFKAHYGLPDDLAKARGTDRDVSFCQFVVASEETFEINDAAASPHLPQYLVEKYDVRAYLGIPIHYNQHVVGSLCVLDTKPRAFTSAERAELEKLAQLVDDRLMAIHQKRKESSRTLLAHATYPALEEIKDTFKPINAGISYGHMAVREIDTFLSIAERAAYGKVFSKEEILGPLTRAKAVLSKYRNDLYNMEVSAEDAQDCVEALEKAFEGAPTTLLHEIATFGRELARHTTVQTGGVFLPDIEEDIYVSVQRPFGVSLITVALSYFSAKLAKYEKNERIVVRLDTDDSHASLLISCKSLADTSLQKILQELDSFTSEEPSVSVCLEGQQIRLAFSRIYSRS